MGIERSFHDGNPEDRAYARDYWTWLERQPQQAWLYYARNANWDQAEGLFIEMVRDPRCDRALASWLFWSADPAHWIERETRPPDPTLIGAILDRSAGSGFSDAGLRYQRVEVALHALRTAEALARLDGSPPFRIPRELCASFEGGNPDLPPFDPATERDLQEIFRNLDGDLPRSDRDSLERNRRGGNYWYEKALRLPSEPRADDGLSDIEAIEGVFGEHRSGLERIEQARMASRAKAAGAGLVSDGRTASVNLGLNPDPKMRLMGLALLGLAALALLFVLVT